MHQQRQTSPRQVRQRRSQIILVDHGEAIDPGMNQKALEPQHSRGGERFDVRLIVFDHAAPRRPIHPALALRRCTLRLERSDRGRRRQAVQGHVHQQRVAAGRSGARRGVEAFPLGPSGIVDVYVRIDQPGKNRGIAEIVDFRAGRNLRGRNNRLDLFAFAPEWRPDGFLRGVTTRRETKACKLMVSVAVPRGSGHQEPSLSRPLHFFNLPSSRIQAEKSFARFRDSAYTCFL